MSETSLPDVPAFTVARGNPTEEETAALVAVLVGLAAAQRKKAVPLELRNLGGGWKSYWHVVRQPLNPGHEPWRASFRGY